MVENKEGPQVAAGFVFFYFDTGMQVAQIVPDLVIYPRLALILDPFVPISQLAWGRFCLSMKSDLVAPQIRVLPP